MDQDRADHPAVALEAEVWRRSQTAHRRWAWQAVPGALAVLAALLVGGTRTDTSAGPGLGDRPGGFLAWFGLLLVVGAVGSTRAEPDLDRRPSAAIAALLGALAVVAALRSAALADGATPWPFVGILGAAWILGTAATELVRLRALLASRPDELPTRRQLWALRRRARDTSARPQQAPEA